MEKAKVSPVSLLLPFVACDTNAPRVCVLLDQRSVDSGVAHGCQQLSSFGRCYGRHQGGSALHVRYIPALQSTTLAAQSARRGPQLGLHIMRSYVDEHGSTLPLFPTARKPDLDVLYPKAATSIPSQAEALCNPLGVAIVHAAQPPTQHLRVSHARATTQPVVARLRYPSALVPQPHAAVPS